MNSDKHGWGAPSSGGGPEAAKPRLVAHSRSPMSAAKLGPLKLPRDRTVSAGPSQQPTVNGFLVPHYYMKDSRGGKRTYFVV